MPASVEHKKGKSLSRADSLRPHGLYSPPGAPIHGIFQALVWSWLPLPSPGDFPTRESNPGLLHRRQMLYRLSHQGSLWSIYTNKEDR